ncbi:hypothetical protein KTE71_24710, partial [Burkholderia multivorans]|nr:hypothetical protein [Burkholderia multivorans]
SSCSAALRCQQQRSEIMNTVSQLVNNFFHYIVATAGFFFLRRAGAHTAAHVRLRFPFRAAFP